MARRGHVALDLLVPLDPLHVIRIGGDGRVVEVVVRRRRGALPLDRRGAPGVGRSLLAAEQRPQEGVGQQRQPDAQDQRPGRGEAVVQLEVRGVVRVTPRHAARAHDELREEREAVTAAIRPEVSLYIFPVIFGHQ